MYRRAHTAHLGPRVGPEQARRVAPPAPDAGRQGRVVEGMPMAPACGAPGPARTPVPHTCGPRHGARCAQPRHWGQATGSQGVGKASASQGRGRVVDAAVAVTYTAAGFTDAWQCQQLRGNVPKQAKRKCGIFLASNLPRVSPMRLPIPCRRTRCEENGQEGKISLWMPKKKITHFHTASINAVSGQR